MFCRLLLFWNWKIGMRGMCSGYVFSKYRAAFLKHLYELCGGALHGDDGESRLSWVHSGHLFGDKWSRNFGVHQLRSRSVCCHVREYCVHWLCGWDLLGHDRADDFGVRKLRGRAVCFLDWKH
jgi:hypothetical protein